MGGGKGFVETGNRELFPAVVLKIHIDPSVLTHEIVYLWKDLLGREKREQSNKRLGPSDLRHHFLIKRAAMPGTKKDKPLYRRMDRLDLFARNAGWR
jgi:hypothetical protein